MVRIVGPGSCHEVGHGRVGRVQRMSVANLVRSRYEPGPAKETPKVPDDSRETEDELQSYEGADNLLRSWAESNRPSSDSAWDNLEPILRARRDERDWDLEDGEVFP